MYCGETRCELTDEHIIPLSLGGRLQLYEASCKSCEDITKKFEQVVARTIFHPFRTYMQFPTRRKKERPSSFRVRIENRDGSIDHAMLPADLHPSPAIFVTWGFPRLLGGNSRDDGKMECHYIMYIPDKSSIRKSFERLNAMEFEQPSFHALPFARLPAKIGYTFGIYKACITPSPLSQLPYFIIGRSDDYFDFVGGEPADENEQKQILAPGAPYIPHRLQITQETYAGRKFAVVNIRLFMPFGGPHYKVVLAGSPL